MHLIFDHVLESLVVRRSQEDHNFHLFTCESVVHHFISSKLVAKTVQLRTDSLNRVSVATLTASDSLEGGRIALSAS